MKKGMEVPPWAAAIIIAVVVIVVGWFTYRATGPKPKIDMSSPEFAEKMRKAMAGSGRGIPQTQTAPQGQAGPR